MIEDIYLNKNARRHFADDGHFLKKRFVLF